MSNTNEHKWSDYKEKVPSISWPNKDWQIFFDLTTAMSNLNTACGALFGALTMRSNIDPTSSEYREPVSSAAKSMEKEVTNLNNLLKRITSSRDASGRFLGTKAANSSPSHTKTSSAKKPGQTKKSVVK